MSLGGHIEFNAAVRPGQSATTGMWGLLGAYTAGAASSCCIHWRSARCGCHRLAERPAVAVPVPEPTAAQEPAISPATKPPSGLIQDLPQMTRADYVHRAAGRRRRHLALTVDAHHPAGPYKVTALTAPSACPASTPGTRAAPRSRPDQADRRTQRLPCGHPEVRPRLGLF